MTPAVSLHQHRLGLSRREALQVGFSGLLGLNFSQTMGRPAAANDRPAGARKAKSVILVFCTGAPAHQDIWDLKPEAPAEGRGEFKPADWSTVDMVNGDGSLRAACGAYRVGQAEDRRRTAEARFDHHLVNPPEPTAVEELLARFSSNTNDGKVNCQGLKRA